MTYEITQYDSAFEHESDSSTQIPYHVEPGHAIVLEPGDYTKLGRLYAVVHQGQVLIEATYDPELDACRELLKLGYTGKLVTYRGQMPCMVLDIERAAQLTVRDNCYGTPVFVKHRDGH